MTRRTATSSNTAQRIAGRLLKTGVLPIVASGLFVAAMIASTVPSAFAADFARGRALYENHCMFCHNQKIHSRSNSLPMTKNEVRLMVDDWRRQSNLAWTPEEIEDVVEYLNVTRYKFPAD